MHGGGREEGLFKFAQHLANLNADIIALQLTEISDDGCDTAGNGASFELNGWPINLFSLHLFWENYGPEIIRDKRSTTEAEIYESEKDWLNKSQELSVPLLLVGDFNTPSHQDWIEETKQSHYGRVIEWPTTKILTEAGFTDTFRALNDPIEEPGTTWPFNYNKARADSNEPADRIDYIFYQGSQLIPLEAFTYPKDKNLSPREWPSDHAAVVVDFIWEQEVDDYDGNGI
uniref:Endonuclease/exonuclease/phosphatase domain-containing protein n=1 Tax=Meloidogyne javanica TaxID=6303 RepID=A0A915ND50_MELJA